MPVNEEYPNALPAGYRLEHYRLESVLGHGGFGITYRAVDQDLQQVVAIKEYLPREVALRDRDSTVVPVSESDRETFEWGLERFLDEARTLARFRHPNIVGVRRFLRANGTAYLVMDYCEGESLESVLAREGALAPERLGAMLVPLLNALEALHAAGVGGACENRPSRTNFRFQFCRLLTDNPSATQNAAWLRPLGACRCNNSRQATASRRVRFHPIACTPHGILDGAQRMTRRPRAIGRLRMDGYSRTR